jgi:hypothetical protein
VLPRRRPQRRIRRRGPVSGHTGERRVGQFGRVMANRRFCSLAVIPRNSAPCPLMPVFSRGSRQPVPRLPNRDRHLSCRGTAPPASLVTTEPKVTMAPTCTGVPAKRTARRGLAPLFPTIVMIVCEKRTIAPFFAHDHPIGRKGLKAGWIIPIWLARKRRHPQPVRSRSTGGISGVNGAIGDIVTTIMAVGPTGHEAVNHQEWDKSGTDANAVISGEAAVLRPGLARETLTPTMQSLDL